VTRQCALGRLPWRNDDPAVAERAFQPAVLWGKHSCHATAEEYRRLVAICRDNGQTPKMLRLHSEQLIRGVKGELEEIHCRCNELMSRGGLEKAAKLLNDTIDLYPGNRTLVLLCMATMIDYMREHGVEQSYLIRYRHSLLNLPA
jgi:hypothetical protein